MPITRFGLASVFIMALAACGGDTTGAPPPPPAPESAAPNPEETRDMAAPAPDAGPDAAHAELMPTEGSEVRGSLTFRRIEGGVRLTGIVSGLEAGGTHGFHIHEFGDCSAPDATSAGGHWSPQSHQHGRRSHGEFHAGDMDNLQADEGGNATIDYVLEGLEIGTDSDMDVVGKSVIVHKGTDDYVTQPTGDAGARAACGVVELQRD